MRTKLPENITNREEAFNFLKSLHDNGESYHPEDDAHDIIWMTTDPTFEEREQLNKLMNQIFNLNVDPCKIILELL